MEIGANNKRCIHIYLFKHQGKWIFSLFTNTTSEMSAKNKGLHNPLYWNVYSININNHVTEIVWARWLVGSVHRNDEQNSNGGQPHFRYMYWGIAICKDVLYNRGASMLDIHHEHFEVSLAPSNISSHTMDFRYCQDSQPLKRTLKPC